MAAFLRRIASALIPPWYCGNVNVPIKFILRTNVLRGRRELIEMTRKFDSQDQFQQLLIRSRSLGVVARDKPLEPLTSNLSLLDPSKTYLVVVEKDDIQDELRESGGSSHAPSEEERGESMPTRTETPST